MLTEVGHGLDARNLETTATLLPDGGFELHSPSWAAAKFVITCRAPSCQGWSPNIGTDACHRQLQEEASPLLPLSLLDWSSKARIVESVLSSFP